MLIRMDATRAKYAAYLHEGDLNVRREVYADFLADSFHDPRFWNQLSQRQPSIFTSMARAVWGWFDKALSALKSKGWESSQYFSDLLKARSHLADAMAEFAARENGRALNTAIESHAQRTGTPLAQVYGMVHTAMSGAPGTNAVLQTYSMVLS